jgi:hypothetical protein
MEPVVAWLVSLMASLAPPEVAAAQPAFPGWAETAEERAARYESIASDLAAVVYAPETRPLYSGRRARARTAALLVALAFKESGFAPDVDRGPCVKIRDPKTGYARCDGGASACMLQVRTGAGTTLEGWTREELFADRKKCFTAGMNAARRSFVACARLGLDSLLNVYASGTCERGGPQGKERLDLALRLVSRPGAPIDAAVSNGASPASLGAAGASASVDPPDGSSESIGASTGQPGPSAAR